MAVKQQVQEDVWIPTTCYMCYNCCNIVVNRVNGVVVKIEGNPKSPHNESRICAKGNAAIMGLYNPNRVTKPLKRTNPQKGIGIDPGWQEISWEEAIKTMSAKLREIKETDPRKLMFVSFDTHGFGTTGKAWAAAFGTPNVSSGSAGWFCGNGMHPIAWSTHGSFMLEPDFDYANYLILFGSRVGFPTMGLNPMMQGPKAAEARQDRGMKIVAIDPYCCEAASKADEWVPIRPGTDAAMALAMVNVLVNEEGIYDRDFLKKYTNAPYLVGDDGYYVRDAEGQVLIWDETSGGAKPFHAEGTAPALEGNYQVDGSGARPGFQLLKEHVKKYTPENVQDITTVPAAVTRRIAKEFGRAASIGSTITIEGKVLPLRPVVVDYNKGAVAHRHGYATGWACQTLNTIMGAVDVPGGHLGISARGPDWEPWEGPDGIIAAADKMAIYNMPYPPKKPVRPKTLELTELFPSAVYSRAMLVEGILHPEKYGLDYQMEMLIICRCNMLMTGADREMLEQAYRKIPFVVHFALHMEETSEFADLVLPDTHVLERMDPFTNRIHAWINTGRGDWYWTIRQPVVEPPPGVKPWTETLFDVAEDLGLLDDFFLTLNTFLKLKEPYKLKAGQRYTYLDIIDNYLKTQYGPEYDLAWFKENGVLVTPRKLEEAYPRPFMKARIPLYVEHLKRQGIQLKALTAELGLQDWDVADYQPLPDWRPCPSYENHGGFDLIAINPKDPLHTFSFTMTCAWLAEISELYPDSKGCLMNPETARRKGLKNGDHVVISTPEGKKQKGKVFVFEGVHPEVIVIRGVRGHWGRERKKYLGDTGIHFNSLLTYDTKYIDTVSGAFDCCLRVRVDKA